MKLTARRLEIMQAIARGGILFQAGWMSDFRPRWRDRSKRESHCSFYAAAGRRLMVPQHRRVCSAMVGKMEACGLIEKFKPHAGVPCYRVTPLGQLALVRAE
jgi:hypothetical protein